MLAVEAFPPATPEHVFSHFSCAAVTVIVLELLTLPSVAVTRTEVSVVTVVAVNGKSAEIAPAGTRTVAGAFRTPLLLAMLTVTPPAGAGAVK